MEAFLWVFVAIEALCAAGFVYTLASGEYARRTAAGTALNLVVTLGLVGWALWLLAKG